MSRGWDEFDADDGPPWEFWAQATKNALNGRRGQRFLRELREALLAMPEKRLIAGDMWRRHDPTDDYPQGEEGVCALGQYATYKGAREAMEKVFDPKEEDDIYESAAWISKRFDVATTAAYAVAFENDEVFARTAEERWERMLRWVNDHIHGGAA